jgi:hypothetical protein
VKIARVVQEPVGKQRELRPVIYFQNATKGLVCNRINWRSIAKHYGDNSEGWGGKVIELFKSETEYAGSMVPCVRVRIPQGADQKAPPPMHDRDDPRTSSFDTPLSDDTPF